MYEFIKYSSTRRSFYFLAEVGLAEIEDLVVDRTSGKLIVSSDPMMLCEYTATDASALSLIQGMELRAYLLEQFVTDTSPPPKYRVRSECEYFVDVLKQLTYKETVPDLENSDSVSLRRQVSHLLEQFQDHTIDLLSARETLSEHFLKVMKTWDQLEKEIAVCKLELGDSGSAEVEKEKESAAELRMEFSYAAMDFGAQILRHPYLNQWASRGNQPRVELITSQMAKMRAALPLPPMSRFENPK